MVMTSHQVSGLIGSQQAAFGQFQSYAQQITPSYGGQQQQGNPMSGYGGAPSMGYGSPYGAGIGMAPPPPPQPAVGNFNPMAMAGGYGGQAAMGMAYGGLMQPGSHGGQVLGERAVNTGLNAANTIGTGANTIAGAAGVASMFGIGGAGVAMAGGIPMMGALAAGGYALNQVGTGAQQRQQVNRVLRRNFGGMMGVGQGRGGKGFGADEMGGISSMVREMGTDDLFTNMEELTRVMDKTAGMGLYRGVQSARDFKAKFKQTISTLKEVATTMNTTLEEATDFMGQGRQMGFFSGADINRNLMKTRFGAGASGLSVGQVQQMGSSGAQMGRMMGMRGRQGAQAAQNMGMRVAQGMQMGIFSDEMISEATGGLTGGEGATAVALQNMEANHRWLQSGAGQAELAGLWDPETGGIDQNRLRRVQSGQMSIRELRTVGRANVAGGGGRRSEFFSQKERIAGELQEAGGGSLGIAVIGEHFARRRGLELDDPAVQRFIRKRTGRTQAQVELAIAEWRNAPEIMERQRARTGDQMKQAARTKAMEHVGVRGIERKMSQWWEREVENPFREVGDRVTTSVSRSIRQLSDDFEGRVKTHISQEAKEAYMQLAQFGEVIDSKNSFGGGGLSTPMNEIRGRNAVANAKRNQYGGGGGWLNQAYSLMGGATDSDLSAFGMLRSASRGLGEWTGAREGGSLLEESEALGLVHKGAGGGYRFTSDAKKYRQRGTKGEGEWRGGSAVDMEKLSAVYGQAMSDLQTSAEDMGIDATAAKRMSTSALNIVAEHYSGTEKRDTGLGVSPMERKAMQLQRMELLGSKDEELKGAFKKAGTFKKKLALLGRLQEGGEMAESYRVALTPGGGDVRDLEETMEGIRGRQEDAIKGLAGLRYEKTTEHTTMRGGRGGTAGTTYKETSYHSLGLNQEAVRGLMQNETVRENFQAFLSGTPKEKADAMGKLRSIAEGDSEKMGAGQREALKQLTDKGLVSGKVSGHTLRSQVAEYLEATSEEAGVAVRAREAEVGTQVLASMEKNQWRFEAAGSKEAASKVKEIATLRQSGKMKEAMAAERKFYAAYSGNEDVQKALSDTPGLEYMSAGLGATARLAKSLSAPGRKGMSQTHRLLKHALRASGLEGLDITQKELQNMADQVEAGHGDFMTQIEERVIKSGDKSLLEKLNRRRGLLTNAEQVGLKGIEEGEAETYAAGAGAAKGAGLRMEGAGEDRMATSELQQKIYNQMKTSYQLAQTVAVADAVGLKAIKASVDAANKAAEEE